MSSHIANTFGAPRIGSGKLTVISCVPVLAGGNLSTPVIMSPFCIVFSDSSIIYSDITKPPIFRWFQPVCSDFESGRCRPCDYQLIYICKSNCSVFPHSKYFWRSAHRFWKINGNFLRAGIGRWKSIYSSYYVAILYCSNKYFQTNQPVFVCVQAYTSLKRGFRSFP